MGYTKAQRAAKKERALHIEAEYSAHYLNLTGKIVERKNADDYWQISVTKIGYANHVVTPNVQCQVDADDIADTEDKSYAWRVQCGVLYNVELKRAQGVVKLLKSVDKGLRKFETQFGPAKTFAEYVLRFAATQNVSNFIIDNDMFTICTAEEVQTWINATIEAYRDAQQAKAA